MAVAVYTRLMGVETTKTDAEQPMTYENGVKAEYCGHACLAFVCVVHAYGYNDCGKISMLASKDDMHW